MTDVNAPDPDVAAFLAMVAAASAPGFAEMEVDEAREAVASMVSLLDMPAAPDVEARDYSFLSGGTRLAARAYAPPHAVETDPVVLFFHGGGWVTGDIDVYDSFCRFLAREAGLRVVSADYRRAPEAPFPAAFDDAMAAARWLTSIDSPFSGACGIILAGDSAGGNLATAAAQALSREGLPIAAQLLLYPVLDVSKQSASYLECGEGNLLTRADMEHFIACYTPDVAMRDDPRCSPLLASDLRLAPPAVILACGLDPLRNEARAYAAALANAGVSVNFMEARGHIHGLATLRRAIPSAETVIRRAINLLKQFTC